jgi:hypothetical protein
MADTQPTQAMGDRKFAPDSDSNPQNRSEGGESNGGAYPNPHTGKEGAGERSGFMGHGGQTEIAYSGTGQGGHDDDKDVGNDNAVTE